MDEYNQTGIRLLATGEVQYFQVKDGQTTSTEQLVLPEGVTIVRVQRSGVLQGLVGAGLSNGQLIVFKPNYSVDVAIDGKSKVVTPSITFPYGTTPLIVNDNQQPLTTFSLRDDDNALQVLATGNNQLLWQRFAAQKAESEEGSFGLSSAMDDSDSEDKVFERTSNMALATDSSAISNVVLGQSARWAYVLTKSDIAVFKITDGEPKLYQNLKPDLQGAQITKAIPLQGEISLLVGDSKGVVSQWFLVRDPNSVEDKFSLKRIRSFQLGSMLRLPRLRQKLNVKVLPRAMLKVILVIFIPRLSARLVFTMPPVHLFNALSISARSEGVLVQAQDSASFWNLHAEHPDISMNSGMGKSVV
jgi:phosphate transport system permease protein